MAKKLTRYFNWIGIETKGLSLCTVVLVYSDVHWRVERNQQ